MIFRGVGLLFLAATVASSSTPTYKAFFTNPSTQLTGIGDINSGICSYFQRIIPGTRLDIALYQWDLDFNGVDSVATCLVSALEAAGGQARARIVLDPNNNDRNCTSFRTLQAAQAKGLLTYHFAHVWQAGGKVNHTKMHNKFYAFESISGASAAVLVSSGNIKNSQLYQANEMVAIENDTSLLHGYQGFFDTIFNKTNPAKYTYQSASGLGGSKAYYFPKSKKGAAFGADSVLSILQHMSDGVKAFPGKGYTLRVQMSFWTGKRAYPLVTALAALQSQGVDVQLNLRNDGKGGVNTKVFSRLMVSRVPFVKVPKGAGTYKGSIHSKFFVYHGPYSKTPLVDYVFTGSHNWSQNALRYNWENMVKLPLKSVADQFRSHWAVCRAPSLATAADSQPTPAWIN